MQFIGVKKKQSNKYMWWSLRSKQKQDIISLYLLSVWGGKDWYENSLIICWERPSRLSVLVFCAESYLEFWCPWKKSNLWGRKYSGYFNVSKYVRNSNSYINCVFPIYIPMIKIYILGRARDDWQCLRTKQNTYTLIKLYNYSFGLKLNFYKIATLLCS